MTEIDDEIIANRQIHHERRGWSRNAPNMPTLKKPDSKHVTVDWLLTRKTEADVKKEQEKLEKKEK